MRKPRKPQLKTGIISDLTEIVLYLTVTLGVLVACSIMMFNSPLPSSARSDSPHQPINSGHTSILSSSREATHEMDLDKNSEILDQIKKNEAEINAQLNKLDAHLDRTTVAHSPHAIIEVNSPALSRFGFEPKRQQSTEQDQSSVEEVLAASRAEMRNKVNNLRKTLRSLFGSIAASAENEIVTFRRRYLVRELDWLMHYR